MRRYERFLTLLCPCVCVHMSEMKMAPSCRTSTMLVVLTLLVAALPMHGCHAYKVLLIPFIGKSHVFSIAAIAEGLANRGHKVTFLLGENYRLNLPELRNRTEISVMRFKDTAMDYDGIAEECTRSAIESGGSLKQMVSLVSIMKGVYVYILPRHAHAASAHA